ARRARSICRQSRTSRERPPARGGTGAHEQARPGVACMAASAESDRRGPPTTARGKRDGVHCGRCRSRVGCMADARVTTRNARFQQWHALLTNRTKRQREGEFLVHGVRPISLAVEYGWVVRALLFDADRPRLSEWAHRMLDTVDTTRVAVGADLISE